jgi:hypothetical protein
VSDAGAEFAAESDDAGNAGAGALELAVVGATETAAGETATGSGTAGVARSTVGETSAGALARAIGVACRLDTAAIAIATAAVATPPKIHGSKLRSLFMGGLSSRRFGGRINIRKELEQPGRAMDGDQVRDYTRSKLRNYMNNKYNIIAVSSSISMPARLR